MSKRIAIWCSLVVMATVPVWAGNGHMLHGFGPVNSSMAGAGAGLWIEPAGALMFNPALLASCDGSEITFATELFEDDITIEVVLSQQGADLLNAGSRDSEGNPLDPRGRVNNRTAGETGLTDPPNEVGVLPTIGWAMHKPGSQWAVGFGLVAVAGFRTDYPEDPDTILFAVPSRGGFGRIFTDYRVTRIPFAVAYQASPKLALGASLNAFLAQLAIAPLPYLVYDVGEPNPTRYYAEGANLVTETAFAVQLGFLYTASPKLSIGGSYTSEQDYDPFTWVSTFASPDLPNFGENRPLDYDLDGPWNATLGVGFKPNPKTDVAFDVMYIEYAGVSGFGSPGGVVFDEDDPIQGPAPSLPPVPGEPVGIGGTVNPFGWRDVWVYKAGVQYRASSKWTLRAGYNHSTNPIQREKVLSATGAPATFSDHYTLGVGYQITPQLRADAAFYKVPREHVEGPYPSLFDQELGRMTTSNGLTAGLIGLHWKF